MSSRIDITLRPARAVGIVATLPWLAMAGFALAMMASGQRWLLPIVAVAFAAGLHALRCQGALASRRSVCGLRLHEGQLFACHNDNSVVAVKPGSGSRIGARFCALQLRRAENGRYHATVLLLSGTRGNLLADDARRLRLWLRLGQTLAPGADTP